MLFAFTLCESVVVAFICSNVEDKSTVAIAAGMTAAMVTGLTLYAIFTKTDFTTCCGMIVVIMVVMLTFGILAIVSGSKTLHLIYCSIGVILFGLYIIIDT